VGSPRAHRGDPRGDRVRTKAPANFDQVANEGGNAEALSRVLFRDYFFPFEVTSILLIVAAIAVVVLASRSADRSRGRR
jgi:NADH:ubiquinone oxidoreductase subunit 6 (subunit J)